MKEFRIEESVELWHVGFGSFGYETLGQSIV